MPPRHAQARVPKGVSTSPWHCTLCARAAARAPCYTTSASCPNVQPRRQSTKATRCSPHWLRARRPRSSMIRLIRRVPRTARCLWRPIGSGSWRCTGHLELWRALPLCDPRVVVVVIRQTGRRPVHPPRGQVRRGWSVWRWRLSFEIRERCVLSGGHRLRWSRGATSRQRSLPELALVLRQHHLARLFGARQQEASVSSFLGVGRMLCASERDEGPIATWLASLLEENVVDLPISGKFCLQSGLVGVVRYRSDEDFLRPLRGDKRWLCRLDAGSSARESILPEQSLMSCHGDLARLQRPGERQYPVAGFLRQASLLRRGERDEGPVAPALVAKLHEYVHDLPVLGELGLQGCIVDAVRQGADEDFSRALAHRRGEAGAATAGICRHGVLLIAVAT
mmetsp:Transcript_2097/g.5127  ORF Transcript_2097/g.5127 Transcript_2097/m.5127 type:complete len:395 (+) Transcript_2097:174-1358(+)